MKNHKNTLLEALRPLLLAALIPAFCCVSSWADELKPIFTLKIASPNELIAIGEKIADLGEAFGTDEDNEEKIAELRGNLQEIKGFLEEMQGIIGGDMGIGFAINLNFYSLSPEAPWKVFEPILFLPVSNFGAAIEKLASTPGMEEVAMVVNQFTRRLNARQYLIETPFISFMATQTDEFLVIAPTGTALQMQGAAKDLLSDIDRFTIGAKLDFEGASLESMLQLAQALANWGGDFLDDLPESAENVLPFLTIMQLLDPAEFAAELAEQPLFASLQEIKAVYGGFLFDPATMDM